MNTISYFTYFLFITPFAITPTTAPMFLSFRSFALFIIMCVFWYIRSKRFVSSQSCLFYKSHIQYLHPTLLTNNSVRLRLLTIIIISSLFFRVRFHANSARGRQWKKKRRMEYRNSRASIRWWDMIWDVRMFILKRRTWREKKNQFDAQNNP